MGWLEQHLETFVKPYLESIPEIGSAVPYFKAEELTVLKNCWRSVKRVAEGRKILLAGRDVFVFEILARRENYPTLFLPQCSRASVVALRTEIKEKLFLFDTGFMGSIPRALGIDEYKLVSFCTRGSNKQVFPKMTMSRHLALRVEATPKYWKTGRVVDGVVVQELSDKDEFARAVLLTIEVYKNSAPRFIKEHKPLRQIGGMYVGA